MGTLTESMVRLRDEIVTLRQKRSLGQAELVRGAAARRAGVGALRADFSRDRALAHRSWFGPSAAERRAAEVQQERRLAEEAKAKAEHDRRLAEEAKARSKAEHDRRLAEEAKARAQAEHDRRLAEEASARAQAEHDRELAEEAKARMAAEPKSTAPEETVAAPAVAQAVQEHKSPGGHPASRKHKASQDKASKRHSSK